MQLNYNMKDRQLTKSFNLSEFHCKDGTPVPVHLISNAIYLAVQLQKIRDELHLDLLKINSAYRTKIWNLQVKGSTNSNHLNCMAADLVQFNMSNKDFFIKIKKLVIDKKIPDGEILYYENFVHYAPNVEFEHYPIKLNTVPLSNYLFK